MSCVSNFSDLNSFVEGVVATYDQSVLNRLGCSRGGAALDRGKSISQNISEKLPKELVACIASFSFNMTEWVSLSGILNPNASRSAVEESAKIKLKDLNICRCPSLSARSQMMTHIFKEAFAAAPPERKIEIISEAEKYHPAFQRIYSRIKKILMEAFEMIGNFLGNSWVQIALAGTVAFISASVCVAVQIYFSDLIPSTIEQALASMVNRCPIAVIETGSKLVDVIKLVARNQIWIVLASSILKIFLPGFFMRAFDVLLIPSHIRVFLFLLPARIFCGLFILASDGVRKIEGCFKEISSVIQQNLVGVGPENALKAWLDIGDEIDARRKLA